jgi:hypothetical protein
LLDWNTNKNITSRANIIQRWSKDQFEWSVEYLLTTIENFSAKIILWKTSCHSFLSSTSYSKVFERNIILRRIIGVKPSYYFLYDIRQLLLILSVRYIYIFLSHKIDVIELINKKFLHLNRWPFHFWKVSLYISENLLINKNIMINIYMYKQYTRKKITQLIKDTHHLKSI